MNIQPGFTIPVLDHGFVRYIDHMGSDARIVEAARISFNQPSKGDEKDRKLLEYLYRNKHTSPFEMAKLTLNVKMPIFVMRQWVRHRMQNLNEVSARYTELPNEFYIPKKWRKNLGAGQNKQQSVVEEDWDAEAADANGSKLIPLNQYFSDEVKTHCVESYRLYKELIDAGVARELARMVLPINIYTEIYCCWDLKNLLHFITLREDAHAQAEIQEYSRAIKQICEWLFPWTMQAYEKVKWTIVEKA